MLRAAVVGVGHLGRHHARWLAKIENVELVGVFDVDFERAQLVASEVGVGVFSSLDELISKVDLCSVVVSTAHHYSVAKTLLSAGIHCLVEKPLAATLKEADELVAISEAKGIVLSVGHIERFNPAVKAVQGTSMQPKFIEAHRLAAFNPRGADVAVILDLMIHDIELCQNFIGSKVVRIDASAVSVVSNTFDIANARLTYANGAVANLTASRISLQAMRKLRIFQPSSYYSLDLGARKAEVYQLESDEKATHPEHSKVIPIGDSGKNIVYSQIVPDDTDMLGSEL